MKATYGVEKHTQPYLVEILKLHEVLVYIISNQSPQFTFQSWKEFQEAMNSIVELSTANGSSIWEDCWEPMWWMSAKVKKVSCN